MIKIENTETYGWKAAIRGMRNPMNSWEKSDSDESQGVVAESNCDSARVFDDFDSFMEECGSCRKCNFYAFTEHNIGNNDFTLMKTLIKAGTDHSKFMRMITETCDITAPLYWWKEFDTYKVGTVRNSCSTMHTIHKKKFDIDDFSFDNLSALGMNMLQDTICVLNILRKNYINTTEKSFWYDMIAMLPSCYNQRATVQMNYAVLRNMYHSRKNHKLTEWHDFCEWMESLPYSELITED